MKVQTLMTALLASIVSIPVLYAEGTENETSKCACKECKCTREKPAFPPHGSHEQMYGKDMKIPPERRGVYMKGKQGMPRDKRGEFKYSKAAMDAVKNYQENPTEENKAKLKAQLASDYDANIKKMEERLSTMKAKKEETVGKRLDRLTMDKKKGKQK